MSKKLADNKTLLRKFSKEYSDIESVSEIKEDAFLECVEEMTREELEYNALNYNGPINIYEIALEHPEFEYAKLDVDKIDNVSIPSNAAFDISFFRQKPIQLFNNIFKFMLIMQIIMFVFFQLPAFSYVITYPFAMFVLRYTKDDINFFTTKESQDFYKGMDNYLNKLPFWVLVDVFIIITLIFNLLAAPVFVRIFGYIIFGFVFTFIAKKVYADQGSDKKKSERKAKYFYDSRNELWVPEDLRMPKFQNIYNDIQDKTLAFNLKYNADELKDFEKKISKREDFDEWLVGYNKYEDEEENL